ncbi:selection and upkeep of intraepithelial T-cells protein 1-like [Archocentrus centrarchus]|uniref:selection and upkeep of intraepithelial T-cells protein 1-like n=1 Tax=Archocentrus centrarchus TaxID=63155 RepID=UPI0011E9B4B3|nr:selection and upkeep of intraepithelial T-cells protein 1-like [Archocentrus centrarchus]
MFHRLFVVAGLLSSYTGGSLAHGHTERVVAFAGGDVILPCSFSISDDSEFPTVEWSKEGLKPDVVFLYRDGCETYEMKNPAFEYRTSLIMKELKDGNISLRISNVQVSDAGKYQCLTFLKKAGRKVTRVELVVVAVSEPKILLIPAEGGGLALHCEVGCWLPEPRITFLDDKGKSISAENPSRDQDPRGCFTVTQRATLSRATSSVTCRVHQSEFNQTRETKILIPDFCMKVHVGSFAIAVAGTALCLLVAAGVISLLFKKCGQPAVVNQQQSVNSSDQSITCELPLLQPRVNSMDSWVNGGTGQLKSESGFHMEDETLCKQPKNKVTRLSRTVIIRSYSTATPAPAHPSQRRPRIFSSPDIFNIYSEQSNSSLADRSLLKINSAASPHPRTLLRRHSSVLPCLHDFNKRYNLLEDFTEDDELIAFKDQK